MTRHHEAHTRSAKRWTSPSRRSRSLAAIALALAAAVAAAGCGGAATDEPVGKDRAVHVVLTSTCACCQKWVAHMRENGFKVTVEEVDNQSLGAVKIEHHLSPTLYSCHTATVEGYVVEGHVPADVVARMLDEKPDIAGIAAPGMPAGSPGMESPNPEPYDIVAFDAAGRVTQVFARR